MTNLPQEDLRILFCNSLVAIHAIWEENWPSMRSILIFIAYFHILYQTTVPLDLDLLSTIHPTCHHGKDSQVQVCLRLLACDLVDDHVLHVG